MYRLAIALLALAAVLLAVMYYNVSCLSEAMAASTAQCTATVNQAVSCAATGLSTE